MRSSLLGLVLLGLLAPALRADVAAPPDYDQQVAPILKKYCAGCHNGQDLEGGLSVENFADLQKGGDNGPALLPGDPKSSRLLRLVTGQAKPVMPPKGKPAPSAAEIELLRGWIEAGAKGPAGVEPDRTQLRTPKIAAAKGLKPITATAWSPDGQWIAVGRFGEIEILKAADKTSSTKLGNIAGKVNALEFSQDGKWLVAATGITGLHGTAVVYSTADGKILKEFAGHRDTLYAATLTRDGKILATGSYDKQIILWDTATGTQLRTLKGHNDAVYDLAFHPDGSILASASGDQTIKLWQVSTGVRLDTLSQPLKEQLTVAFSPDGKLVAAGGVDNRIRVWKLVSREKPEINPLLVARFAHDAPLVQMAFTADGKTLVTTAEDRTVKLWDAATFESRAALEAQPDVASALALSPNSQELVVGRMNGTLQAYPVTQGGSTTPAVAANPTAPVATPVAATNAPMSAIAEVEPNNLLENATALTLPAKVTGVIQALPGATAANDPDLFRFDAKAGQQWVLEINAARNKSPLDSRLEILDAKGNRIERLRLQALRDSYITFRGLDSNGRDARLHNWEEMSLNDYVYLNGEVVKLFLAPRGPDSGFSFYPHEGTRRTWFDTSAITHAVNEPCYVVRPLAPGEAPIANGLPVFPLFYENDDDGLRKFGSDSRLNFTAPADGTYFARVTDVRGFQGEAYKYELTVRPAKADFNVTLQGVNPTINAGSGKEFVVQVERIDGFDGEIRVDVTGLPPGFAATTPLVIPAGHDVARGSLNCLPNSPALTGDIGKQSAVTATAMVNGQAVTKLVNNFGEIKLAGAPKILVTLLPTGTAAQPPVDAHGIPEPFDLTIAPGQTITAIVRVQRNGFDARITFEALNHNLPHGVIIDNIGLNGLMIVEGQTERTFFLTAADWIPETTRTFHLKCNDDGGQTSWPVRLHVKKPVGNQQAAR